MSTLKQRLLPLVTIFATGRRRPLRLPCRRSRKPRSGVSECCHITYTLNKATNPTADQADAYRRITSAMDHALTTYNCYYTNVSKALNVSYNRVSPPPTPTSTVQSDLVRSRRCRRSPRCTRISHTLGVGTSGSWSPRISGGIWTGSAATAQFAHPHRRPGGRTAWRSPTLLAVRVVLHE